MLLAFTISVRNGFTQFSPTPFPYVLQNRTIHTA